MWYNILKVGSNASKEEIENAYRKLSQDPKIINDMSKSYQIRQAYFEGIKQASNNSSSLNTSSDNTVLNRQNNSTNYSNGHNNFNKSNSQNNSAKYVLTILIIVFVVALIILGTIFVFMFANVGRSISKNEVSFDSEILTCVANDAGMDEVEVSNSALNRELRENGYEIEDVTRYSYIAHKSVDDYMIIIEVRMLEKLKCDISVNYEVDATEIMEEEYTTSLIGTVSLGYDYFENDNSYYSYDLQYHTTYPVSRIVEVAFDYVYFNNEDTIEFSTYNDDNEEKLEKYAELITDEQFYEMTEILKEEIDEYR